MRVSKADVWLAVCVMVMACAYLYADARLPAERIGDPLGPKAFPALVGIGLLLSGFLLLLENWRKRKSPDEAPGAKPSLAPGARHQSWILVAMAVWMALYYSVFTRLGYMVSTVVFLLGLLSYFHRGRHVANVTIAVGFTVVFDLLFSRFLGVPLPTGLLSI